MTAKLQKLNLIDRLTNAYTVCSDCGQKYGKYSVGCSSVWQGKCDVCGETKGVTETRDYGYLEKGIAAEKAKLLVTNDCADIYSGQIDSMPSEDAASYEQGEIACMFTEAEIDSLITAISDFYDKHPQGQDAALDSAFGKITELYEDHCIRYELSPALKAYNAKYGSWGMENELELARWEGFRDAYVEAHREE